MSKEFKIIFVVGFGEKLVLRLLAVRFKMLYRQMLQSTLVTVVAHFLIAPGVSLE